MSFRIDRRRTISAAAVVTAPVVLAVLALMNPGFPLARVDLNDGGVWLTATAQLKLGRLNTQVEELNGGLVTTGGKFDVLQDAGDVLLVEPGTDSVVDPANVTLTTQVQVPAGATTEMHAGTVAVLDAAGNAWVRTFAAFGSLRTATEAPDLVLGEGGRIAVTDSGAVLGVAGGSGEVTRAVIADGAVRTSPVGTLGEAPEALTAVGEQPVGLSGSTVRTVHGAVELNGSGLVLQQPGPRADVALVASTSALLEVPLGGGTVVEHRTTGTGRPARPVLLDGCEHAAWATATGSYLRICDGGTPEVLDLEGMTSADQLAFRVNRHIVVLNDTLQGRLWMPQVDQALRQPNWADIVPEDKPDQQQEKSDGSETTQQLVTECGTQSAPPVATEDSFGVRPGRSTILPVINNDSSSDCGILAISQFEPIPAEFGRLEMIYGGRSLQLVVAPGATGTVSFRYTIMDGRGTSAPSTARVQLTVRDLSTNDPPVQVRTGSLRVEQGARTDYSALADFVDPDGDDLQLVSATAESGSARFRQDGNLTYVADGGTLGRTRVHVVVSDGTATADGVIDVDVRPAGSLAPQVDPVFAVTYVDQPVLLQPLLAVRSASDEPVRLAGVDEVQGATIVTDLAAGTFTFSAARAGSYYVPFVVAAAPQQATGLARIDVKERPTEVAPPIAVRDEASLPAGGDVTIDPLANDTDPAGGVLVLQSVDVPADSGLRVAVLAHQLVQISSERTLLAPVTVPYVVSNGTTSTVGEISVRPVPAATTAQPPVVQNVEVSVRTGGVVTVPVLDGAYDPDGDKLTLDPTLAEPLAPGEGLLFVSGDVLRYQAPSTTLTAHATFNVRDATGNVTAATLTVRVHASDPSTKAPPRPRDLTARAFQGDTIRIPIPLVGIDDDGDGVTLLGPALAPVKGRITSVGADYLEYEALPGELGTDTFTYAVEDWVGQRSVATIRVGISPRPTTASQVVARDDAVTVRPGQRVEVRVLANDVDPSGGELSLDPTLEMAAGTDAHVDGRRIIVQAPTTPGVIQIAYTATNARAGRDTAVLTVTVAEAAVVLPPVARDVVVPPIDTLGRSSVEVDVLAVAQNPSGPLSDLAVSVPASAADVAVVTPAGKVMVTLVDHAQTLPYLLTNTAPQAGGVSTYAFITVPALGFFPPTPRPKAPELRVASGAQLVIPLDEQVQVAPGRTARIADPVGVTATKSDGSALVRDATTLTYTSAPGYAGPASITVPVTDRTGSDDTTGRTTTITLSITVYAIDDHPPTFDPAVIELAPGETPVPVDLRVFTQGPQGEDAAVDLYAYQLTSDVPAGFTATLAGSVLSVSAAKSTQKGTTGALALTIGYGKSGSMPVQVDLRVIASKRPTARLVDRVVTNGEQGRDLAVDVLADAFNPFPDTPLVIVGATVETPGAGTISASASAVTVRPDAQFVGQMVTRYRVRDATGDADREVEGRLTVVVRGRPDTPKAPKVVEVRDRTVVLAWDAPDNRGEPITGYRLTAISASGTVVRACPSTTCTFDNLTNDTEYTFTVAAQNAVDWSDPSPASSPSVRPDAVPDAPDAPTTSFGDRSVTASWAVPTSLGSAVTKYDVSITPAPASGPANVSTSSTSVTFDHLVNGTAYTVRVRAYNKLPTPGEWSPSSAPITPAGVPGAPTVSAERVDTPLGGQINVSWAAPSGNGDDALTYELSASGGPGAGSVVLSDPRARSYAFTGAQNGTAYTFSVRATNKAGQGDAGSVTTSTYGLPGGVGSLSATGSSNGDPGQGSVTLRWSGADGNGTSITGYRVKRNGADDPDASASSPLTIGGLAGGELQTYQVQACSIAGCGAWSQVATATPTTRPSSPTSLGFSVTASETTGEPTTITASWGAPSLPGAAGTMEYVATAYVDGNKVSSSGRITGLSADLDLAGKVAWSGSNVRVDVVATLNGSSDTASTAQTLRWGDVPTEVTNLAMTASGQAAVTATWAAPLSNGGLSITTYLVDYDVGDGNGWTSADDVKPGGTLTSTYSLSKLKITADLVVKVRVTAVNAKGNGPPSVASVTVVAP